MLPTTTVPPALGLWALCPQLCKRLLVSHRVKVRQDLLLLREVPSIRQVLGCFSVAEDPGGYPQTLIIEGDLLFFLSPTPLEAQGMNGLPEGDQRGHSAQPNHVMSSLWVMNFGMSWATSGHRPPAWAGEGATAGGNHGTFSEPPWQSNCWPSLTGGNGRCCQCVRGMGAASQEPTRGKLRIIPQLGCVGGGGLPGEDQFPLQKGQGEKRRQAMAAKRARMLMERGDKPEGDCSLPEECGQLLQMEINLRPADVWLGSDLFFPRILLIGERRPDCAYLHVSIQTHPIQSMTAASYSVKSLTPHSSPAVSVLSCPQNERANESDVILNLTTVFQLSQARSFFDRQSFKVNAKTQSTIASCPAAT
ncbi:hypothetical protein ACRRTK_007240 [Alexandromys fortis]